MSEIEDELSWQIHAAELPKPHREYTFMAGRRWRFDFAWTMNDDAWIAVEIEGGTWSGGRHTRGYGFEADCEKYNEAALRGWRVLRFTADMVRDGRALATIEKTFEAIRILSMR